MDLCSSKKFAAYLHNLYSVNSNTDVTIEVILKKIPYHIAQQDEQEWMPKYVALLQTRPAL